MGGHRGLSGNRDFCDDVALLYQMLSPQKAASVIIEKFDGWLSFWLMRGSSVSDGPRLLAFAENRPHRRNCRDQPDQGEGSPNHLSFLSESISEE